MLCLVTLFLLLRKLRTKLNSTTNNPPGRSRETDIFEVRSRVCLADVSSKGTFDLAAALALETEVVVPVTCGE